MANDGKIPVAAAKRVAKEHELRQVLLIGYDGDMVHVVTYGVTKEDCDRAAKAQDFWTGRIREFSFKGDPASVFEQLRDVDPDAHHALEAVAAECIGQRQREGWTLAHDDGHSKGELAVAAGCYAQHGGGVGRLVPEKIPTWWPWSREWWKPQTPMRDLTRAGALIAAEMGRLFRKGRAES